MKYNRDALGSCCLSPTERQFGKNSNRHCSKPNTDSKGFVHGLIGHAAPGVIFGRGLWLPHVTCHVSVDHATSVHTYLPAAAFNVPNLESNDEKDSIDCASPDLHAVCCCQRVCVDVVDKYTMGNHMFVTTETIFGRCIKLVCKRSSRDPGLIRGWIGKFRLRAGPGYTI